MTETPKLWCVVVTFRRPVGLEATLTGVLAQTRPPDHVVVVDNEASPSPATEAAVSSARREGVPVELLAPGENLGPAGGTALAMEWILERAGEDDWITRVDDDHAPDFPDVFERLERFAREQRGVDERVGAVGAVGARYDWRRGRLLRIADEELVGPVEVDYVATNCFPAFSVAAVRDVGPFDPELFYGSSEVEYGLRLRRGGYRLFADSELWTRLGRVTEHTAGPSLRLRPWNWRRYYSLRNQIFLLRSYGYGKTAVRVALLRAIAKPLANVIVSPVDALFHLRMNLRAVRDGWTGRLGRTLEPDDV